MTKDVVEILRTMDIHLLTQVADDGSPFGVEYTTRRLTLDASGRVTCDVPDDGIWQTLSAGLAGREPHRGQVLKPSDGARFLDGMADYFRYHFLSPHLPLILDHRGAARPDDFRIVWNPTERPGGGHGYGFSYQTSAQDLRERTGPTLLVASLNSWRFMHEFDSPQAARLNPPNGTPRMVTVDLLSHDSPAWAEAGLEADGVIRETKGFLRAFLRRFFERRTLGVFPETEGQSGRFTWSGLF